VEVCVATIPDSELRMWRACSWALVLTLLGLGLCWMFYLPTVGKGGLFRGSDVNAALLGKSWDRWENVVDCDALSSAGC